MNHTEVLKMDIANVYLEDGIVVVEFLSKRITLDQAKLIVQMRLDLVRENSYPVLVDGRKVATLDKEARSHFASPDAMKGVKAGAILIDSTFNKFLGNFFLKVTYKKEKLPTMIFTDKKSAISWLKKFN